MKKEELKERISKFKYSDMIFNQLYSYELTLRKQGLKENTIQRKVKDIGMFFCHMQDLVEVGQEVRFDNITDIAFTYVRDGYFTREDLEGSYGYRRAIYSNIKKGFNYVYDEYNNNLINKLTKEQKEILEDISVNNWFRCSDEKDTANVNDSIQTQLIEKLGLKVYFDENNKAYVYSHEMAELISKRNVDLMNSIKEILEKINACEFTPVAKSTDFTMVQDSYIDSKREKRPTMRLYKDLAIKYILGLTPRKNDKNYNDIIVFQYRYIDAFNFIEEEHNLLLKKHAELKNNFMKMYEKMRKQNRNLIVGKKK